MLTGILVAIALLVLPLVLLLGLVGLTLFLWCWKRIGPYFINLGRWTGDWRNLIPCGCLLLAGLLVAWCASRLPYPLGTVGVLLLALLGIVTVVIGTFAAIALTITSVRWLWVSYRRLFWQGVDALGDILWKKTPTTIEARSPRSPSHHGGSIAAEASLAGPASPGHRAAQRRSSMAAFWDLLLGKPSPAKRQQPRAAGMHTTDQVLGPSGTIAATTGTGPRISHSSSAAAQPSAKRTEARRSWITSFWSLMLGRPPKLKRLEAHGDDPEAAPEAVRQGNSRAVPANMGDATMTPEHTVPADRSETGKPAKRGSSGGFRSSMMRLVTFVPRAIYRGTLRLVEKMHEIIEWMRMRLNID